MWRQGITNITYLLKKSNKYKTKLIQLTGTNTGYLRHIKVAFG
jgi:hypothetical protein